MTQKYYLLLLLLVSLSLQPIGAKAQFGSFASFNLEINKLSSFFDDIDVHMTISATGCTVPRVGFAHIHPTYTLTSTKDPNHILFQEEGMFILLDEENCTNGVFSETLKIRIPRSKFTGADESFVLFLSLRHKKKTWSTQSHSFTLENIVDFFDDRELDQLLKNPASVFRSAEKNTKSFISAKQQGVIVGKRGVSIRTLVESDFQAPSVYVHFYLNGQRCSEQINNIVFTSHASDTELFMPYTSLFIPPGKHHLAYRVFGETDSLKHQELFSGTVSVTQPQLHWLSFESKNADINVEGMDKQSGFLKVFSKDTGYGVGDAYYVIRNNYDILFTSPEASNSGYIRDCIGHVQTYLNERLTISFWDKDGIGADFIEDIEITPKTSRREQVNTRNQGRIRHFDFSYQLTPVTAENYREKNR